MILVKTLWRWEGNYPQLCQTIWNRVTCFIDVRNMTAGTLYKTASVTQDLEACSFSSNAPFSVVDWHWKHLWAPQSCLIHCNRVKGSRVCAQCLQPYCVYGKHGKRIFYWVSHHLFIKHVLHDRWPLCTCLFLHTQSVPCLPFLSPEGRHVQLKWMGSDLLKGEDSCYYAVSTLDIKWVLHQF